MRVLDEQEALARVGGDPELLREIAELFQLECPQALENLRDAINRGDAEGAGRVAHGLKGSASNFGARPAVEEALKIEHMAREGRIRETASVYETLAEHLATLIQELQQL